MIEYNPRRGGGGGGGLWEGVGGGGKVMYWTPRGKVWEEVFPSHGGDFWEMWVLNSGFCAL